MTDDRKLLEDAARAAGFGDDQGRFTWTESEYPRGSGKHGALWNYRGHMDTSELWNPLTDDGDALRLAIALDMSVEISAYEATTYAFAGAVPRVDANEMWRGDKAAATRRAIVRAAASLAAKDTQ